MKRVIVWTMGSSSYRKLTPGENPFNYLRPRNTWGKHRITAHSDLYRYYQEYGHKPYSLLETLYVTREGELLNSDGYEYQSRFTSFIKRIPENLQGQAHYKNRLGLQVLYNDLPAL